MSGFVDYCLVYLKRGRKLMNTGELKVPRQETGRLTAPSRPDAQPLPIPWLRKGCTAALGTSLQRRAIRHPRRLQAS